MCLTKDLAWIKKYFDPFMFPDEKKFEITDDEATEDAKVNYGVHMMRCRV